VPFLFLSAKVLDSLLAFDMLGGVVIKINARSRLFRRYQMMPDYLIDGAEHLWINEFIENMDTWPADMDANIVVYCASGYRG
jgi:rhodanese-related sulfurtransferase